jgi:hypothetical protein
MNKSTKKPSSAPRDKEHGEGNYKATREYDRATGEFIQAGKVEPAARAARPRTAQEARDMERAEAEGKKHSKGEDPALRRARSR